MGYAKFTTEYKQQFLNNVQQYRDQGMNLKDATKKAGHSVITYRLWKKTLTGDSKVVFHKTPTITKRKYTKKATTTPERVAVFYCTPTQAAEIIRGL